MTPQQVAELTAAFAASSGRAQALYARHDAATLARRTRPEAWSPAECLVHLTLTARSYMPPMEAAIAGLEQRGATTTRASKPDLIGRLLAWSLEPPARMRTKTTAPFVPGAIEAPQSVLPDFIAEQDRITGLLARTQGLDLGAVKVTSSFDARIRYNVLSAFVIMAAHERRHLWQAEQALASVH